MTEKYPSYMQLQKALRLACELLEDYEYILPLGMFDRTCDDSEAENWEKYFLTEVEK